jgi:hypothetical protein
MDSEHVRNQRFCSGGNKDSSPSPDAMQRRERRNSTGGGFYFELPYPSYPRELGQQLDSRQFHQSSAPALISSHGFPNLAPITMALRKEASLLSLTRNDSRLSLLSDSLEHSSPATNFTSLVPSGARVGAPITVHMSSPGSSSKMKKALIGDYNISQQIVGVGTPRSKRRKSTMPIIRQFESPISTSPEKQKSSRALRQSFSRSKGEKVPCDSPARTNDQSKRRAQRRASTGSSPPDSIPPLTTHEEEKTLVKPGMASRLGIGLLRGSKKEWPKSNQRWN